ncbi:MAG TPA: MDR family MFS transporter, partial [Polyangiaceae bacterium]|nr:MDR family MFS transporter [Polyangiaceae bacterium]
LYAWITTAYLITSTVLVPIYGKLSDTFGRKPILLAAIFVFLVGSACCGLSNSALSLILSRALQGVGSAGLFTTAFAVVADLFPPAERGKYQGIFGGAFGLASVLGPLVGGFIADRLGWHWVFFVNLPVGAVAVAFVLLRMPALGQRRARGSLDVGGALALLLAVVPVLLALTLGRSGDAPARGGYPWSSWPIAALFAVGLGGAAAFVAIERRARDPLLDLGLFRDRTFAIGNVATFVLGMTFLAAIVFLPLFMVNVVGLSATHAGLTTTPLTFGIVAGNIASGQIVARTGRYKPTMLAALVLLIGAFAVMGFTLSPTSTQGEVTLKMAAVGLGLGPTVPLYTLAIQNSVPPQRTGVATASATFFRAMGSTIGVTLMGTVFAGALAARLEAELTPLLRDAPLPVRDALAGANAAPAVGHEGAESARLGFDVQGARRALTEHFELRRAQLTSDLTSGSERDRALARAALAALERERHDALTAVERLDRGAKTALTSAIERVYQLCILIALVGLLFTRALPELPLRRRPPPPAQGPD